jgi:POT family proton-dependent oligopeptide transporter
MFQEKHPVCLWWLALVFSLFMFAFGGLLASLVLYLHQQLHLPLPVAYGVFGAFASMMWTLPLLGGALAGRLGHKRAVGVGIVVIFFGLTLLVSDHLFVNSVGLSLFVVGNALFTPALWCLVDHAYSKHDSRREGGFTYFYLLFNLGAVAGIFLGGLAAHSLGFDWAFALDALVVGLGALVYLLKNARLVFHPDRAFHHTASLKRGVLLLSGSAILATPITTCLLYDVRANTIVLYALSLLVCFLMCRLALSYRDKQVRYRLFAFIALVFVSIAFWSVYNLEPSMLSVFVEHNVSRHLGGWTLPAESFFAFEGLFVIVVGLIFSRVWVFLSVRDRDLSLPLKFSLSLILIGLGFLWLVLGTHVFGAGRLMPLLWMVCAYAFFAAGELLVGPIGISMVGRLSPPGKEGLLMGVWQLYQGLAAVFGGVLASVSVVSSAHASLVQSNRLYDRLFTQVGLVVIVLGLITACFVPVIKRLIR